MFCGRWPGQIISVCVYVPVLLCDAYSSGYEVHCVSCVSYLHLIWKKGDVESWHYHWCNVTRWQRLYGEVVRWINQSSVHIHTLHPGFEKANFATWSTPQKNGIVWHTPDPDFCRLPAQVPPKPSDGPEKQTLRQEWQHLTAGATINLSFIFQ